MGSRSRRSKASSQPTKAVNAPRQKWPKMHNKETGEFSDAHIEFTKDMTVCYDLVKVGAHILKKPKLRLVAGTERDGVTVPCTDGTNIFLPKMHPQRRLITKHELSHLYFKSNIPLRLLFVRDMVARIEKESNKKFSPPIKDKLITDLCFVINIFDDIRVNSLWGLLYPGDGQDLEDWYQDELGPQMATSAKESYPDGDIEHLFTYIILISLRQEAKSTQWEKYKEDIEWAAQQVTLKTFNACLLLVRDLVLKIARDTKDEEPLDPNASVGGGNVNPTDTDDQEYEDASQAAGPGDVIPDDDLDNLIKKRIQKEDSDKDLVDTLAKMSMSPSPNSDFENDNAGFDFRQTPKTSDADLLTDLQDLDNLTHQDLDQVLQDLEQNAIDDVVEIQAAMASTGEQKPGGSNFKNEDEFLKKSVKAKVNIHRIGRRDVAPVALGPEDLQAAERWKRYFQRVMGAMSHRTEETGYEMLTDLYVQQRIGQEPLNCFKVDTVGRGFRLNLLSDMSGSMYSTFTEVEKLAAVMQKSLDFPFVKLGLWGFNSLKQGEVDMYKFARGVQGLRSGKSEVGGVTPLPMAVQVAGRELTGHRDDNHLFVLSDGFPVYQLADRQWGVATKTLINWTTDAVRELRAKKVKVYCFMIGHGTPPDKDMDKMFGPGYWKKIPSDSVYDAAFSLITNKFMTFLRTR